jgi:hypothetical protein
MSKLQILECLNNLFLFWQTVFVESNGFCKLSWNEKMTVFDTS